MLLGVTVLILAYLMVEYVYEKNLVLKEHSAFEIYFRCNIWKYDSRGWRCFLYAR